ncbi:MAG: murein biosynthesis integral membrane protein MurJ [Deltaproteobacteria bacterium]|nr:murein biosynthesis integral membrane protein MurJ [Deltaproteobacteria bacterium]
MTAMTLVSRVLGLVREQVRAIYLGTGAASDAFGIATTIPNLFRRLFAEGAMTAAFVPIFTEYLKKSSAEETRRFLSRFVTWLTFIVTLFTILGIILTPQIIQIFFASEFANVPGKVALTITLTQIMWPYLVFVTIAAVLQGILNAHHIFGPSAFAPVLMNLGIIVGALALAEVMPDPSYALVIGFLLGGVLQLVFQVPWLFRSTPIRFGVDFHFRDPGVNRLIKVMAPGMFAAGVYQFNVFASQLIAAGLEEGSVSSLQYSIRLQELVLGLFVVSVAQVILPRLSEQTALEDHEGVKRTTSYAVRLIAFVTLPCTVLLVLLAEPIVKALFQFGAFDQRSTEATAFALRFHALGLFFIGQARVLTQVFFAYKDLKSPLWVSAGDLVVNIGLCLALSLPLAQGGIALAASLAALVQSVALHALLARRLGSLGLGALLARVGRMALAAAVMAGALLGLDALWPAAGITSRVTLFGWLALAGALAAGTYLVCAHLAGADELDELWSALKRKLRRKR